MAAYQHLFDELENVGPFIRALEYNDSLNIDTLADISASIVALLGSAQRPIPLSVASKLVQKVKESPFSLDQQSKMNAVIQDHVGLGVTQPKAADKDVKQSFHAPLGILAFLPQHVWTRLLNNTISFSCKQNTVVELLSRGGMLNPSPPTRADIVAVCAAAHFDSSPPAHLLYDAVHDMQYTFAAQKKSNVTMHIIWPLDPSDLPPRVFSALYAAGEPIEPPIDIDFCRHIRKTTSCRSTSKLVRDAAPPGRRRRAKSEPSGNVAIASSPSPTVKREPHTPTSRRDASPSPASSPISATLDDADLPHVSPSQLAHMCTTFKWSARQAIALGSVFGIQSADVERAFVTQSSQPKSLHIGDLRQRATGRLELASLVAAEPRSLQLSCPTRVHTVGAKSDARAVVAAMEASAVDVASKAAATAAAAKAAASLMRKPAAAKAAAVKDATADAHVKKRPAGMKRARAIGGADAIPFVVRWEDGDDARNRNVFQCKWYNRAKTRHAHLTPAEQSAAMKRAHHAAGELWELHS
jgi:hypothetical protein